VNGPTNCPAIRSGRVFSVKARPTPVICPFMPFAEGTTATSACRSPRAPTRSARSSWSRRSGRSSKDTFAPPPPDRVALLARQPPRPETAQRQATTDGSPACTTGTSYRRSYGCCTRSPPGTASRTRGGNGRRRSEAGQRHVGHEMGDLALTRVRNTVKKTIASRTSACGPVAMSSWCSHRTAARRGEGPGRARARGGRSAGRAEPHTAVTVSVGGRRGGPGGPPSRSSRLPMPCSMPAKRAGKDRVMSSTGPAAEAGTTPS